MADLQVEPNTASRLPDLLAERIMVLDGAMGTMIQSHQLQEHDFRGQRFAEHPVDLQGLCDQIAVGKGFG